MSQSYPLGLLNMSFKFASTSEIIILDWYMQHTDFTRLPTALMRLRGCGKGLVNEMGGGKDRTNFFYLLLQLKRLKSGHWQWNVFFGLWRQWDIDSCFSPPISWPRSPSYTKQIHYITASTASFCHKVTDDFCRCTCEWIYLQHLQAKRDSYDTHQWTWRTGLCRLRHAS